VQPQSASPSAASALAIDIRRFPWMRRLATDYAFAYEHVAPFFAGDPALPFAWRETIGRVQAHMRAPAELARVLAGQQERRGAPAASRAAAARLSDPRTVVIITGQQAGLFGGPLYTLLKALTTMKLAEQVSRDHGVTVVPVFWIDGEDHDFAEVSSCSVLDAEQQPQTIRLADLPGAGELPVAQLSLTADVEAAVLALERALPPTEFTPALLTDIREAYQQGRGMADAFGRLMETVLGPYGLVVYDSADPASKPLVADLFAREVANPGSTAQLAARAGHALQSRGYHAQVTPTEHGLSLFYINGGRELLRYDDGQVSIGGRTVPLMSVVEEARRAPEHFSPNVLLRPLVQDTIFPTICYVAGPNELAYLGQLRDVYEHFGVPMPLMYQRATASIVDSAALRFLTKYDVAFETLRRQDELALNQLLEDQLPPTVEQALTDVERVIAERMERVAGVVPQIDPTLEGAVKSTLGRMQHDLRTLHGKVIQAAKRRDETLRRQFTRAQVQLFPHGHPQERELGTIWFLNRYGPALVERLLDVLPLQMGHHWVLTI
jgi:bacillithiol biosynthesis cysteine-adding enzyme BshC